MILFSHFINLYRVALIIGATDPSGRGRHVFHCVPGDRLPARGVNPQTARISPARGVKACRG